MHRIYSDFEKGTSGIVENGVRMPRNTFSMRLKVLVEAEEFTGYKAEVIREIDKKPGYITLCTFAYYHSN